ncbi:hypothetical protein L911_3166 [Vibrio fluvialis I21563]|nr:hypothetical protein L911_3166 [Vibrio fluvialis I21563]
MMKHVETRNHFTDNTGTQRKNCSDSKNAEETRQQINKHFDCNLN